MTGCMHRDTHQTITAETNVLDIKPDLVVNCGNATLDLHLAGGWALPGGGRAADGGQVKNAALKLAAIMKRCKGR